MVGLTPPPQADILAVCILFLNLSLINEEYAKNHLNLRIFATLSREYLMAPCFQGKMLKKSLELSQSALFLLDNNFNNFNFVLSITTILYSFYHAFQAQ